MENKRIVLESESLPTGVFELPGEPAIVINGVPDATVCDGSIVPSCFPSDTVVGDLGSTGLGEWLEGREVRKRFGDNYYTGTVVQFDKGSGWYRVVYEDGDFEDHYWPELEEVLLPLEMTVPLKSLALKTFKKSQKTTHKSGTVVSRSHTGKARKGEAKFGTTKEGF
ncbi:hypothetical protein Tsubulata_030327 [Turnera subulata]|uniref:PTM/DIR17-like Tudor domain-containing protein n=1 Tax=Turnera subulata TaxID=218843 RepID=A0A9Q0JSA4_9ROSI|nr:hypothetical protein Tsubulata_030327 [Turnera subulata]